MGVPGTRYAITTGSPLVRRAPPHARNRVKNDGRRRRRGWPCPCAADQDCPAEERLGLLTPRVQRVTAVANRQIMTQLRGHESGVLRHDAGSPAPGDALSQQRVLPCRACGAMRISRPAVTDARHCDLIPCAAAPAVFPPARAPPATLYAAPCAGPLGAYGTDSLCASVITARRCIVAFVRYAAPPAMGIWRGEETMRDNRRAERDGFPGTLI